MKIPQGFATRGILFNRLPASLFLISYSINYSSLHSTTS
jgi:hypothetical protein